MSGLFARSSRGEPWPDGDGCETKAPTYNSHSPVGPNSTLALFFVPFEGPGSFVLPGREERLGVLAQATHPIQRKENIRKLWPVD